MFNRSQIMTRAWQLYREQLVRWEREKYTFAKCLRSSWAEAKRASLIADPSAYRAQAIRYELATLSARSFQQNIETRRRVLETELSTLAA
jgi:hypothetical protein